MKTLRHRIVDLHARRILPAEVDVLDGRIDAIRPLDSDASVTPGVLLPGFVDAHVHVESSMLPPAEFARVAVRHGTVATVSDPHEIANVLGEAGLDFMLEDAARACMPIHFGVPSCVPATDFETAGASLDSTAVARLLEDDRFRYLSEMMNWPGVLHQDPEVMAKIAAAKRLGKPVDGHAPGLRGDDAVRYAAAGITTDHECFSLEEARDKAQAGMKILIREGSAARNLDALLPILTEFPHLAMFSTDDAHPDELLKGHLDRSVARCVAHGVDVFDVLRAACLHPVEHYGLDVGLLREGDRADFILVDDLVDFRVSRTWIEGRLVAEDGRCTVPGATVATPNVFRDARFEPSDFEIEADVPDARVRVIEAEDGELVTGESIATLATKDGVLQPAPADDVLLVAVCNRYAPAPPAVAFIRGFGLRRGAIASSVAHDSHQVIAVGTSPDAVATAVNAVFERRGGLVAVDGDRTAGLSLPIAGLMSDRPAEEVAAGYEAVSAVARDLGSTLQAPFMTLSFMALLVIPSLKLGDRGLFDGNAFAFTSVRL
ncbi:MAG: adenine deaminase [Phycisphaeraceae bacterium]|nr:adenine deaminase [Phycisphaeraceae bacterium]MCP4939914.1 adenine deaminase [Phycisphaeraceae bacterium]